MVQGVVHRPPKIRGLIELHDEHPEAVEAALIANGLRWRDAGSEWCRWSDIWAVTRTQPWDSPLAKALKPDDWFWYGPDFPVLVETRDLLRIIATKMKVNPRVRREHIPPMTKPPWAEDKNTTRFAPEPVTYDEIMAHLERLNGRR